VDGTAARKTQAANAHRIAADQPQAELNWRLGEIIRAAVRPGARHGATARSPSRAGS